MKLLKISYLFLIFLILSAPVCQMVFNFLPEQTLTGVQIKGAKPHFTLSSLTDRSFQDNMSAWFDTSFGLRGYLVKTYNQILYSLFHEPPYTGENIIIGKSNQLYSSPYIESYLNVRKTLPIDQFQQIATRIKELQELLAEHGIGFILLLTPGKASIYPEYIPDSYLRGSQGINTNPRNFLSALRQHSVNCVDGISILQQGRSLSKAPLFPRGGMHWSEMGAYIVLEQLLAMMSEIGGQNIGKIEVEDCELTAPAGADRDLVDLLNLWFPLSGYLCPKLTLKLVSQDYKPKVLFTGGSFNYMLLGMLSRLELTSCLNFINYYNYKVTYPDPKLIHREILRLDWDNEIFSNDFIILEINETYVNGEFDSLASGFAKDALIKLKHLDLPTKH